MRIAQTEFYKKFLGRSGERRAEKFLKKKGFKIIEKNYRISFGEADLIALYRDLLIFIEVKTRSYESFGTPAEAVGYKKQKTYEKLAAYFLKTHTEYENFAVRFDVIEVSGDEINHIESAFICE